MASPETSDAGAVCEFVAKDGRMTPETQVKNEVVAYLKASGLFWMRLNSGKVKVRGGFLQLCPEGTSDIIVFPANRIVWIELKGRGQATLKSRAEKQLEFRNKVLAAGHHHAVCMSVEEVQAAVNAI
jgi:hypothetical protein